MSADSLKLQSFWPIKIPSVEFNMDDELEAKIVFTPSVSFHLYSVQCYFKKIKIPVFLLITKNSEQDVVCIGTPCCGSPFAMQPEFEDNAFSICGLCNSKSDFKDYFYSDFNLTDGEWVTLVSYLEDLGFDVLEATFVAQSLRADIQQVHSLYFESIIENCSLPSEIRQALKGPIFRANRDLLWDN